jgi:O-methyltransferase
MAGQIDSTLDLQPYIRDVSLRDDPILRDLRELTATLPGGVAMQVMAEEGQFLELLVRICGATSVLEIGTFTGYSTLCMARALPTDGKIITYDITDKWPSIGAEYWQRAGVSDRIDVRIGDAAEILTAHADDRPDETFDLVFIDADKSLYCEYYEAVFPLVRPGGLIVIDNTLFLGRVADPAAQDPETVAIRRLNTLLFNDSRVDISLVPMADGITLARKK